MKWSRTALQLLFTACVLAQNLDSQRDETTQNITKAYDIPELSSSSFIISENRTFDCHDINLIPKEDRCEFVGTYCADYKIGLINYVSIYYCHGGAKALKILSYISFLMILFITLGITASEFLCPNLDSISKFFKMSESLAGVTLLALGNGSPDVFSTLEAMKVGSANLAIGELCGAALFITCVVVGGMSIVRPFKVVRKPFIRDVLFLIFALVMTVIFVSDGKITIWESLIMLLTYCIYVLFVISWGWFTVNKRRIQLLDQRIRNSYYNASHGMAQYQVGEDNEVNDEDIMGDLHSQPGIEALDELYEENESSKFEDWTRQSQALIKPSILGALEFNAKMQDYYEGREGAIQLDDNDDDPISLNTMDPITNLDAQQRLHTSPNSPFLDRENTPPSPRQVHSAPAIYNFNDYNYRNLNDIDVYDPQAQPDFDDVHQLLKSKLKQAFAKSKFLDEENGLFFAFLPTLKGFAEKSAFDKIFSILCLPLVVILRLTIPVVEENFNISKSGFKLLLVQCIASPLMVGFLNFYQDEWDFRLIWVPSFISAFLISLLYGAKYAIDHGSELASKISKIVCALLGFIIAISWISTIAAELISIIKFFSILLDLSDAILGVTVFAIGNSLGDFISNFTIAKMGFPMMALSACFGGPLLNILLGIGGSGLLVIPRNGPIEVQVSQTLIVGGIALLINLLFLLIFIPLNRFEMNKFTGWFMVGIWTLATMICVILELVL